MKTSNRSNENLIFKTADIDGKIYIREQKGYFQRIRRVLSYFLIILFVTVPFIKYKGAQAVYFDIALQKINVFSFTLFPHDLVIFSLVFIFFAFLLFYITKIYGRVWCGFTCPQTIWMLIFNWVERRIEGAHNHSKALDKQPLTFEKFVKKTVKHAIWLGISLITALVFISYFVPVDQLYLSFFTLKASSLVIYWVLFFTLCTYVNAGWIREKMCLHMCPYARFQSAMFDNGTKLVSYDQFRGENRGKRKISQEKKEGLGDCVDCNLCVQVCPVGIDIRNGLQYECISCGLCVDACDMTMEKFNYQKGLISFKKSNNTIVSWKKHIAYGTCVSLSLLAMLIWGLNWQNFNVNIIRDRQALYNINQTGNIENTYLFKIRNKSNQVKYYHIQVEGLDNANIVSHAKIKVLPGELNVSAINVEVDKPLAKKRSDIYFYIAEVGDDNYMAKKTSFYSGEGSW
ncbi:MAG: cytochrome c oxidase accessory protein CcoG [Colwelliaceae bacterium]|jgi:cytochrome c oxidase accessory protein FixG|nr:cytochrome c oxidase accessory protein CcoG [Colwelliaceae bacterium]